MHPSNQEDVRRPILVADAGFSGTLAAVRALGATGTPVSVADPTTLAPARWSRYATQRLRCPPLHAGSHFAEWLVSFGKANVRHVLCPTSDEFVFAAAVHREALDPYFDMHLPALDVILRVLDKTQLYAHARAVGINVPRTYFPENDADLDRIALEMDAPLLIKPRTQVQLDTKSKGALVTTPGSLREMYARFMRDNVYGDTLLAHCPDARRPMLQEYHAHEGTGIYVLSGFYDVKSSRVVALGATKLLQRPRKLGIGLCFEDAETDPHLVEAMKRFCERTGYFGMFQLEFLQVGEQRLLIDFNPRFYNFLALDIARGLPLPHLVYAAARGDSATVTRLMDGVPGGKKQGSKYFCNRIGLEFLMRAQRLSGRMTADDARRWRAWYADNRGRIVDSVFDSTDVWPVAADITWQLYLAARHPRYFYRSMVLDR